VQREAIVEWAQRHEVELGRIFEELDAPGRGAPRPLLATALARVEAGASRGLVVWKVDRFGVR
jgi:DNA invertase Pin-like site-specific DNA recombinase